MRYGMMNSGPATGFVHVLFSCSFPMDTGTPGRRTWRSGARMGKAC